MVTPKISTVLSLRSMHSTDSLYVDYAINTVIPALCGLVVAVGKDTLWKPLNHSILMMSRDKRKCVRLVSLHALKSLFAEVCASYMYLCACLCIYGLLHTVNQSIDQS